MFSFHPAFVLETIILVDELCSKISTRALFALRMQEIKFVWVNNEKNLASILAHILAVLLVGVLFNRRDRFLPISITHVQ